MKAFGRTHTKFQISEAVHRGVCRHGGTDGRGHCRWYALGGFLLLRFLGMDVHIQTGALNLQPDPDDPTLWIQMDPSSGILGEFHCWLASPVEGVIGGDRMKAGTVIDFSSRHFARYVEDGGAGTWRREGPPSFIWAAVADLPTWYEATSQEGPSRAVASSITEREMKDLGRCVLLALKTGA